MKNALCSLIALLCALLAEPSPAAQALLPGEKIKQAPGAPGTAHTFAIAEGTWIGEVFEDGISEPYRITLALRATGAGEVHYLGAGYDCHGVIAPRSDGPSLMFLETITLRRDQCSDGTVRLTPDGDGFRWEWINPDNVVQATAMLTRAD